MKYSCSTGKINVNAGKNSNFAKFVYAGSKAKRKVRKKGK